MYTIASKTRAVPSGPYLYSFIGKSTFSKPALPDMATGSSCYDIDTQEAYMWDADAQTWIIQ